MKRTKISVKSIVVSIMLWVISKLTKIADYIEKFDPKMQEGFRGFLLIVVFYVGVIIAATVSIVVVVGVPIFLIFCLIVGLAPFTDMIKGESVGIFGIIVGVISAVEWILVLIMIVSAFVMISRD